MPDHDPSSHHAHGKGCSRCGQPAVVTEVTVQQGKKVERRLCAECAREEGISVQSNQPLEQIMTSILLSQQQKQEERREERREREAPASRCGTCGLSFNEFRNKGLLGCADCYRHFEPALGPLLQRSHEGGASHCGKVPSRAGEALGRQQRLAHLRKELAMAVELEQYEEAARLRDEIRTIERGPHASGAGRSGEGEA
ncbi:MAG: UvrB/UvrC motif-containing protein [Phycisphaerales bacterium]